MTDTVHVITDLGPTDEPGLIVPAQMLGPGRRPGPRVTFDGIDLDEFIAPTFDPGPPRHANHPCYVEPVFETRENS